MPTVTKSIPPALLNSDYIHTLNPAVHLQIFNLAILGGHHWAGVWQRISKMEEFLQVQVIFLDSQRVIILPFFRYHIIQWLYSRHLVVACNSSQFRPLTKSNNSIEQYLETMFRDSKFWFYHVESFPWAGAEIGSDLPSFVLTYSSLINPPCSIHGAIEILIVVIAVDWARWYLELCMWRMMSWS